MVKLIILFVLASGQPAMFSSDLMSLKDCRVILDDIPPWVIKQGGKLLSWACVPLRNIRKTDDLQA